MTFKELMKAYYLGEPGPEGGTRAVVRALRDEMVAIWNMRGDPVELLDEILGDAGDKMSEIGDNDTR